MFGDGPLALPTIAGDPDGQALPRHEITPSDEFGSNAYVTVEAVVTSNTSSLSIPPPHERDAEG